MFRVYKRDTHPLHISLQLAIPYEPLGMHSPSLPRVRQRLHGDDAVAFASRASRAYIRIPAANLLTPLLSSLDVAFLVRVLSV